MKNPLAVFKNTTLRATKFPLSRYKQGIANNQILGNHENNHLQ